MSKTTKELKEDLLTPVESASLPTKGALSSGCTVLNLACTGSPFSAFRRGGYYFIVGDSAAGKTVLGGAALGEAAINKRFDDYRLVFDNIEDGAFMFDKFYGPKVTDRITAPRVKDGVAINSVTAEEFYSHVHRNCSEQPTIYVGDSENALSSEGEMDKQEKKRAAIEEGKEISGIMTDHKAKIHSQNLRPTIKLLRDTMSILVLLGQTRDVIGAMPGQDTKTYSGGKALRFYAHLEIWFSVVERIRKTVRGKPREVGIITEAYVKKNRFTGKRSRVRFPIYYSFGIDDLGACVNYLVDEKHWTKSNGVITAKEFDFKGPVESLIQHIEENNYERDLRSLTGDVWREIEEACEVKRKNKYQ